MCIASYGWLPPLRGENQGKAQMMCIYFHQAQSALAPPFLKGQVRTLRKLLKGCFPSSLFGAVAMTTLLSFCQLHGVSQQWL